jgi:Do/DeqQ family serine protease
MIASPSALAARAAAASRFVALALALACALASTAPPAAAQDATPDATEPAAERPPLNRAEVALTFAPVVRRTAPAVVNVYGQGAERPRHPFFEDPFFGDFPGDRRERVRQSVGSGVIVDAEGIVVTNHHVIEGMSEVRVALADKREFDAEVVLRDPRTDLAVLRLDRPSGLVAIELGVAGDLEVGDLVLAIGNPFGVGQTVTQGIVSALARTQVGVSDYQSFIQTDAAINPGNSGGALVDINGRLIGINTAIFSRSGGNQGIGFAIPIDMVKVVVDNARGGSATVRRPWFGASLQAVTNDIAQGLGLDRPTGALVAEVDEGGPAAAAGLRRGDVVVEVDGQPIDDPDGFGFRFATLGLSGEARIAVLRGGERVPLTVRLMPAPETPPRETLRLRGRSPFAGATVSNLSPAVAEELSMDLDGEGVVIVEVDRRSPAGRLGFRKGDVIVAVNDDRVESTRQLRELLQRGSDYWRIAVDRGGRVFTTVIGG